MALAAGRLRQRITIRHSAQEPTGKGGFTAVWSDGPTLWAEVIGLTGREATIGQALQGLSIYRITIRYRTDVTDADQLRYGAIDLNITSISDPDGTREQLVIVATTASAQS